MKSRLRLTRVLVLASTIVAASPMIDAGAALATVEGQRNEVERIVDELDRLHEQADILAEDYAVAVDDESQLKIEIGEAEQRVLAKEAELNALRGDLAEVAVRSFTGAGTDVLGPLFSDASSATEGLNSGRAETACDSVVDDSLTGAPSTAPSSCGGASSAGCSADGGSAGAAGGALGGGGA